MRLVTILLALSVGMTLTCAAGAQEAPADAAKKQASPAKKAAPKRNPVVAIYARHAGRRQIAIQADLIWTGDFNGVPSATSASARSPP